MFLCHLEGLIDALTDGNAGDHDNELAPAIGAVQLIHGFDVGICLADAGLHLYGQVIAIGTSFQFGRRGDLIGTLDFLQMLQDQLVTQLRNNTLVAPAGEITLFIYTDLPIAAVHHIRRSQVRLAGKDIYHSFRCVSLEFLMFVLNFHIFLDNRC